MINRSGLAAAGIATREKGSLNRATIVKTAMRLLDEVGIDGLSTRRLAAELGIRSASLYWHFKDKNELLNEVSGEMFNEALQEPNISGSDFDWAEWLAEGACRIRQTAISRRDGALVMARPRAKGTQTKVAFEDNVKTLMRSGLADMEARLTLQTLRRYAIGAAMQEQANQSVAASQGIVASGEEGFEYGLRVFLEGLKGRIEERARIARTVKKKAG
ncbi:MAG TPA: TetR family transcriptional regulator [Hyphomonadaceae bacterium]|jgi:TetR/AcrR family tetracycline transcriptional repressor|nr:TetR family transcriptional regulator [Hyphomonadaceae bacterium]